MFQNATCHPTLAFLTRSATLHQAGELLHCFRIPDSGLNADFPCISFSSLIASTRGSVACLAPGLNFTATSFSGSKQLKEGSRDVKEGRICTTPGLLYEPSR